MVVTVGAAVVPVVVVVVVAVVEGGAAAVVGGDESLVHAADNNVTPNRLKTDRFSTDLLPHSIDEAMCRIVPNVPTGVESNRGESGTIRGYVAC